MVWRAKLIVTGSIGRVEAKHRMVRGEFEFETLPHVQFILFNETKYWISHSLETKHRYIITCTHHHFYSQDTV